MKTHNIPFQYKIENHCKLSKTCSQVIFSKGLKNEFETAVVNEPSVFEPLKVYCSKIFTVYAVKHHCFKDYNTKSDQNFCH